MPTMIEMIFHILPCVNRSFRCLHIENFELFNDLHQFFSAFLDGEIQDELKNTWGHRTTQNPVGQNSSLVLIRRTLSLGW